MRQHFGRICQDHIYLCDISKHFCHLLLGHVADPMFDLHDSGRYMKKYEKMIHASHHTAHAVTPHHLTITICILNCCMIWFCALREDNDHIWPVLSPIAGNVLCWLGQTSTSGRQYALLGSVLGTPWSFFFNPLECFFLPERPLFTLFHGIDSHDSDKFLIEFEVAGRELDRFSKADIKDLMHGKVIRGLSGKGSWKYPERYAVSSLNCGTIVVELGITMSFVSRGFFHCLVCNVLLCDVRLQ